MTRRMDGSNNIVRQGITRCAVVLAGMVLGGCVTNGMEHFGLGGGAGRIAAEGSVILPRDPSALGDTAVEKLVSKGMDLGRQKRFAEARNALANAREMQTPAGEGYRALTAAMAVLALREGDLTVFARLGRQLDNSLADRDVIDPAYLEIVSIYRMLVDGDQPVNVPHGLKAIHSSLRTSKTKK